MDKTPLGKPGDVKATDATSGLGTESRIDDGVGPHDGQGDERFQVKKYRKETLVYGIQVAQEAPSSEKSLEIKKKKTKAIIEYNEAGRLQCLEKLTFSPDAKGKIIFNFILVIAAFFSTHQATYIACFGFPTSMEVDMIGKTVECIFVLDIILNFFM